MFLDNANDRACIKIGVWGPALAGKGELLKRWYALGRAHDETASHDVLMIFPVDSPGPEDREMMATTEAQLGAPYPGLFTSPATASDICRPSAGSRTFRLRPRSAATRSSAKRPLTHI